MTIRWTPYSSAKAAAVATMSEHLKVIGVARRRPARAGVSAIRRRAAASMRARSSSGVWM
jgi:hypothetical protein